MNRDIFRAYDIRGIFDVDFAPEDFYQIARGYAALFQPRTVALGYDVRKSSPQLWRMVADGLTDSGVDVLNLGQISTDMLYFAVVQYRTDGGIIISASHNPAEYNGLKLIRQNAIPISQDSGLVELRDETERRCRARSTPTRRRGGIKSISFIDAYLAHIRSFIDWQNLSPQRLVLNANCGLAGQVAEQLLADTAIQVCERLFIEPDGTFAQIPEGRPDPLRPENRGLTTKAVKRTGADLAVAWDADADRCFFFDENGEFVEGCYITALLASQLLRRKGGGCVIFDPRAVWSVEEAVRSAFGTSIINRCGHSFIKARMRKNDAIFAGEASGHYYFRDNFYADNGIIPFLFVLEHLCVNEMVLSQWVARLRAEYPVSGEINFEFEKRSQIHDTIDTVRCTMSNWGEPSIETPIDGLSVRFLGSNRVPNWRFNIRQSNTEPLLRLNIESIRDLNLLIEKTQIISEVLESLGGKRVTPFRWE